MTDERPKMTVGGMLMFELAIGVVGLGLGAAFGFDPLETIRRGPEAAGANLWFIAWGTALAMPLLALMLSLDYLNLQWLRSIQEALDEHLLPMLRDVDLAGLAMLSLAAGIGEEILFRGFCQAVAEYWLGPLLGLLIASALFGFCHFVSWAYFVMAAVIGVVLGLAFWWSGTLVVPIVMHAVYDFVALVYLTWRHASEQSISEEEAEEV